ncbi:MAG: DNA primase [Micromonosporaceae bacterium]
MAGRIRDADVALVRERTVIADVISEHVTLKPAGAGNLKGLCPFHDEKTPSFNVSTARNVYYCHGCGVGGDAISFLMQVDHLSFAEAIERLAIKAGVTLRYEETPGGGSGPARKPGLRQRLHAAHQEAVAFYADQLTQPQARIARQFLDSRGFARAAAEAYHCGFAPDAWDQLTRHLRAKGFTADELVTGGLSKPARSGSLIDRFRRRLMWPIREISGEVIGFGARKLFDADDGPKYLNTPETPIYKKSQVLYGIDRAKREIAKQGRAVVVEGYTDVMACHLSDVPTAVATCGTAFGVEHIGVLRRLLMDTDEFVGEIIFTFDGDAAGQKAALRAFADDQRFVAQTFIAVSPDNMDPCDLRLAKGEAAVRDLVARRERLIDFALRSVLRRYDLDSPEGRVAGLRSTAPLVAQIKDRALRPEYARKLAGDLGMEVEPVLRAVSQATSGDLQPPTATSGRRGRGDSEGPRDRRPVPAPDSPQGIVEREALKIAVQLPVLAGPLFDAVDTTPYGHPVHAAVRQAIAEAGGASAATAGADWVERVRAACSDLAAQALVGELSVEPLRYDTEADPRYVTITLARLQLPTVNRRVAELKSRLQRINPVERKDEYLTLAGELFSLEQQARGLKEQALGAL